MRPLLFAALILCGTAPTAQAAPACTMVPTFERIGSTPSCEFSYSNFGSISFDFEVLNSVQTDVNPNDGISPSFVTAATVPYSLSFDEASARLDIIFLPRNGFLAPFGTSTAFDVRWRMTLEGGAAVEARALSGVGAAFGAGSTWDIVQQVCDDRDMSVGCAGTPQEVDQGASDTAMVAFAPVREAAFYVNQRVALVGGSGPSTSGEPVYATLSGWTASFQLQRVQPQAVPEPATAVLALAALAALGAVRRSRVG